ncbi:MAG: GTPase [Planctomycetota bacterium]
MYELNDTIAAVSSPTSEQRVILRISGPETLAVCGQIFDGPIPKERSGILSGSVAVDKDLNIDAKLYVFPGPHSYTGDDVVEIHVDTNAAVVEVLMGKLLERGVRAAEPGEFTARAYLNGKIDLAQAEAVNEIIVSSNEFQLAAAEKLLSGRLAEMTAAVRDDLMECLSLIEAGLDFSGEDIEFITRPQAIERLTAVKDRLEQLLSGSVSYESLIDLPAVGIAGAPNAGKSSLLNKLLGRERSIVSPKSKTTRDVLTGLCTLKHYRCVLFDCAGLLVRPDDILDELAQQAAIEALRNSAVVIFCVDVSEPQWTRDAAVRGLIQPKVLVPVATKCDLLGKDVPAGRLAELNELFAAEFMPVSTVTGAGVELLRETIDRKLIEKFKTPPASMVALTARHRKAVTDAIENIGESVRELNAGNDEVTAMLLRAAYQAVCDIERAGGAHIDEQILEQIFGRFCIGK